MGPAAFTRALATLLVPPLCSACAGPCDRHEPICAACATALAADPGGSAAVEGIGPVVWAAAYRGVARELVAALKFNARLRLAPVLGEAIAGALGPQPADAAVVAVPAAPGRRRARGFDPAELIAAAVAHRLELDLVAPLRRTHGPRQVGRRRAERLASPPCVWAAAPAPAIVLLVDDVLTTGATLVACSAALREAGARRVGAGVFARAVGAGSAGA